MRFARNVLFIVAFMALALLTFGVPMTACANAGHPFVGIAIELLALAAIITWGQRFAHWVQP